MDSHTLIHIIAVTLSAVAGLFAIYAIWHSISIFSSWLQDRGNSHLTLDGVSRLQTSTRCRLKCVAWVPSEWTGIQTAYYLDSSNVLVRHNRNTWKVHGGNDRLLFKDKEVLRVYRKGKLSAVPVAAVTTPPTSDSTLVECNDFIELLTTQPALPKVVTKKSLLDEDPFGV